MEDSLFKEMLWDAACATTIPQFNRKMVAIQRADAKLHDWLSKIPATSWAKSHFIGMINCLCSLFM